MQEQKKRQRVAAPRIQHAGILELLAFQGLHRLAAERRTEHRAHEQQYCV